MSVRVMWKMTRLLLQILNLISLDFADIALWFLFKIYVLKLMTQNEKISIEISAFVWVEKEIDFLEKKDTSS